MNEFIGQLQDYHLGEILIVVSALLVLIDYYFPTDVPCHFGYFCFGVATFLLVPLPMLGSLLLGVGVWLLLAILHQLWFTRFLTNAPGVGPTIHGDADEIPEATCGPTSDTTVIGDDA